MPGCKNGLDDFHEALRTERDRKYTLKEVLFQCQPYGRIECGWEPLVPDEIEYTPLTPDPSDRTLIVGLMFFLLGLAAGALAVLLLGAVT